MEEIMQEILILVKKKMREQGGYDRDAYKTYVQETIDYFIEKGKLTDDDNLDLLEQRLLENWENVEGKLAIE